MMSLAQAVGDLGGAAAGCHLAGAGATEFLSVSIDTRTLESGALYIALRGERFDGHAFGAAAQARGAVALMVERPVADASGLPQIIVPDTRAALGRLAAAWRRRFTLPVIAVTGSNGKTTTTQMIAAILRAAYGSDATDAGRPRWFATRGNRNNAVGVPLMLLELRPGHRAAVFELGMNHPGEIARLADWVRPDVALVTNAQREHQEFLDSVEATARENGAAIAALGAGGTAVFPADDPCAAIWRALAGSRRTLDFALAGAAALRADVEPGAEGNRLHVHGAGAPLTVALAAGGLHNARNALAAAAASLAAGIPAAAVGAGLAAFVPVGGRGVRRRAANGALLIDETYNANPDSVRAAIDLLAQQAGTRVLVLGDMGEVGARGPEFHAEVGAYARARGIEHLFTLGAQAQRAAAAFGAGAEHCAGMEALLAGVLRASGAAPSAVLVKGSRFMRLERVIAALESPGGAVAAAGQESEQHA